jgi:hypothetical protein
MLDVHPAHAASTWRDFFTLCAKDLLSKDLIHTLIEAFAPSGLSSVLAEAPDTISFVFCYIEPLFLKT